MISENLDKSVKTLQGQKHHGNMETGISETGRQGQRMKQGEQGQMEGCQRCDGNRMDLGWGRCSGEGWNGMNFVRDPIGNSASNT